MRVLSLARNALCWLSVLCAPCLAQQFGKAENLAPYIPSPQLVVDRMLEIAQVKPGEMVYDLGSGDGRIVITAAQKFAARGVGVEISEELYQRAKSRIRQLGLEDRVKMIHGSALRVNLSAADVVTLYLLTSSNDRLKPILERDLKSGARVVSNDFEIPGWKPAQVLKVKTDTGTHTIYLYQVGSKKRKG
jgi:ubiquinone/menaquinone biosynthesis C-methylase UbiE